MVTRGRSKLVTVSPDGLPKRTLRANDRFLRERLKAGIVIPSGSDAELSPYAASCGTASLSRVRDEIWNSRGGR